MKYYRIVLILITLLWAQACSVNGPVHAYPGQPRSISETALIRVPGPITVKEIDWKEIDVPSQEDGFYEIYLLPGKHRIDFVYELYWGDNTSGLLIKSDLVGVETQFIAGMIYELTYLIPEDTDEAFELAKKFKAMLIEKQTGRQIASGSMNELNARQYQTTQVTNSSTTQSATSTSVVVTDKSSLPTDIDAKTAANENAVKRLKFWWLMADEDERKRFKEWMKSVENINEAK